MPQSQVSIGVLGFAKEGEGMSRGYPLPSICTKEWFVYQHHILRKPLSTIANDLQVDPSTLSHRFKKFGINVDRSIVKKSIVNPLLRDRDWLEEQYITQQKSPTTIAGELGVNSETIRRWVKRHGIRARTRSEANALHPPFTDEHKAKLSVSIRTACQNPKIRIDRSKRFVGDNNPAKRLDVRAKMSVTRRSRKLAVGKNNGMYGKQAARIVGQWFTHPSGKQVWLRSTYEVRVATALMKMNIAWLYECKSFELGDTGYTYRPDFFLPEYNLWWEVKGWMRPSGAMRLANFFALYPNESLKIIWRSDIENLEYSIDSGSAINIRELGNRKLEG